MCVFLSISPAKHKIEKNFNVRFDSKSVYKPYAAVSAYTFPELPVIGMEDREKVQMMHWGLIPHWVRDESSALKIRVNTVNARAETLSEKPSFRNSLEKKRCAVICDGFYEYQEYNKKKFPYFIYLTDQKLFAMAGLFDQWTEPETGRDYQSFSIITTSANALMQSIHNRKMRMPVILNSDQLEMWLSEDKSYADVNYLLRPYPDGEMKAHTVSSSLAGKNHDAEAATIQNYFPYPELQNRLF